MPMMTARRLGADDRRVAGPSGLGPDANGSSCRPSTAAVSKLCCASPPQPGKSVRTDRHELRTLIGELNLGEVLRNSATRASRRGRRW